MTEYNPRTPSEEAPATREEMISALFAHMVIQQTNLSMMLLGKVAHPQTGKFMQDLDSAKMLIDQLEMLEEKTKGNLSKEESDLLKQALSALRMSFVEVVDSPAAAEPTSEAAPKISTSDAATPAPSQPAASASSPSGEDDSRKRFSKKY